MEDIIKYSYDIDCSYMGYDNLLGYIGKNVDLKKYDFLKHKYESKSDIDPKIELIITIPFDTSVKFNFNDNIIEAIRIKDEKVVSNEIDVDAKMYFEKITLTTEKRDTLDDFLKFLILKNYKKEEDKEYINLYTYEDCRWVLTTSQKKRSLDTIYLDAEIKNKLIKSITEFNGARELHEKFGIPYKKTFLFLGPAGTGKTSMIYALASHFNLNIGICKLTSEKVSLVKAYKSIPKDTILLIEDIEHIFPTIYGESNKFNRSELLNVLDGVMIKDKLLTFMTSNNITSIPKVILRPGRVNDIVNFKYATKKQILDISKSFQPDENHEQFYHNIKHLNKLTPAILQQFLFNKSKDTKISDLEDMIILLSEKNEQEHYTT